MKKLLLCLLILNLSYCLALDLKNDKEVVIKPDIYKTIHKKKLSSVEIQNNKVKKKGIRHLPWSMTERRIEYDSSGQAQFTPYALNDLNLQY